MRSDATLVSALALATVLLGSAAASAETQRRPWRAPAPGSVPPAGRPAGATAPAAAPVPGAAPGAAAPAAPAPVPPPPPAAAPSLSNAEDTMRPPASDPFFDEASDEEEPSEIEKRSRWVKQRRDGEDPRLHKNQVPVATVGQTGGPAPAPAPAAPLPPPPPPPKALVRNAEPGPRPAAPPPPPKVEPQSPTKTVEQIIRRSEVSKDFYEMVDEMLDEIAHQLGKEDAQQLSPMAIRMVRVSPNVHPEFARTLEARLMARIAKATGIRLMVCVECTTMRSRVEDGNWMVNLGVTRQEDMQRLAKSVGVKTFMDFGFSFNDRATIMWMEATVFRASDGGVMWTDAFRSDGTMAALLRTGRRIPSRDERAAELEKKLAGRPYYGYALSLGMMQFGYTGTVGDIAGATMSLRFHERFGENQCNLFGISAGVFTTANLDLSKALNSILLGAYYSHNLSEPNLNHPEFWLYGEGGGIFSGNQGNTFYLEGGGDLHLKWRMSLQAGLQYVFPAKYMAGELGGFGYRVRLAFNW